MFRFPVRKKLNYLYQILLEQSILAAYNNGRLHAKWIDAIREVESIQQEIQKMLSASPIAEVKEFAIHDFEELYMASIPEVAKPILIMRLLDEIFLLAILFHWKLRGECSLFAELTFKNLGRSL